MNQSKIPTIIGIILLIAGLALGVILVKNQNIFRLGAQADAAPKDVRITNIGDSSFSVSWTTDKETTGSISWGESQTKTDNIEEDELEGNNFTHFVTVIGLKPQTKYFIKITSGTKGYDNNGIPWQTETGPTLAGINPASTISGSLLTASGEPAVNALVYVTVGGASTLSTTTSKDGSWAVALSALKTNDLNSSFVVNENTDVLEISANMGPGGTSSAEIYLSAAKPVPPMILGQTHNFKNAPANVTGELPEVSLQLPESATRESKFEIQDTQATAPKSVTIKSIDEGESISSTRPEFFGEGPAGTSISVSVESEVMSANIKVSSDGTWAWTPPTGLSAGSHKITVSWTDANGVVKSITKTFIVQASELPAFESTPSATPTLTPTPKSSNTSTPTPTKTPLPTSTSTSSPSSAFTPKPTASVKPSPSASVSPTGPTATPLTPESGVGIPTIFLTGLGILLLILGVFGGYSLFIK